MYTVYSLRTPHTQTHTLTHTFFFSHVTSHYYKKDQYRRLAESVHTGLIEKKKKRGKKDTGDMKVNLTLPRCSADEHAQYG